MIINFINFILKLLGIKDDTSLQENKKMKILIITKSKNNYGIATPNTLSTGLFNSAQHIVSALEGERNIDIKLVSVVDNNSIDREVALFKPDIVIIEAIWVVPDKFTILKKLHPKVKWVVRIHSEVPFLSFEGVAFEWIRKYLVDQKIYVALNSEKTYKDFINLYDDNMEQILYLPNYFFLTNPRPKIKPDFDDELHIGCFGAIRGLKNQLAQVLAAIEFADRKGATLYYHINNGRTEGFGSENILRNMREVFAYRTEHHLVEHDWLSNDDFQILLTNQIDISLQVSFSETFNLVAADSLACGVPIVVSEEIEWASDGAQVRIPSFIGEIVQKLHKCYMFRRSIVYDSLDNILQHNRRAKRRIIDELGSILE